MELQRRKKLLDLAWAALVVVSGNLVYALGISLFVIPGELITGGTSGISLFINRELGFPIAPVVAVLNISMFLLGWAMMGSSADGLYALGACGYTVSIHIKDGEPAPLFCNLQTCFW